MEDFILYFKMGFFHVLDWQAYDHLLFLIALVVVFTFKDWKKVIWLITWFTIGHTFTLGLAAYKIVNVNIAWVEFLIPLSIFITAFFNLINAKKGSLKNPNINLILAFFFGLIHGLGFSNYFMMLVSASEAKLMPLVQFALGIEIVQILIVVGILTASFIAQKVLKITKRDWVMVVSAIIMGIVIPMLIERKLW